jgi:predicted ABC-type transport system involved in lysophospholipase L1 biosynthesis ATPase subunit
MRRSCCTPEPVGGAGGCSSANDGGLDLDEHTAETPHELLREMHRERGLTSIIATHNPRLAAGCDRVLRLEEGRLREAR